MKNIDESLYTHEETYAKGDGMSKGLENIIAFTCGVAVMAILLDILGVIKL